MVSINGDSQKPKGKASKMTVDSGQYAIAMNFSWVENGLLAGCRGPRSNKDLEFLCSNGIRALVRLAYESENGITGHDVKRNGIKDFYRPIEDFTAPSQEEIDSIMRFIRDGIRGGKPVAVSCGAGCGRTGTILACYPVSLGDSAEYAINKIISIRPCAEEILRVPGQKEAVVEFERRLKFTREQRRKDLDRFYDILKGLEAKVKEKRLLMNCNGRMDWPLRGVYFFFEEGEFRDDGVRQRIVRVGTHAIKNGSNTRLWTRLCTHRGFVRGNFQRGGNHRASVFRLHIGMAIIQRDGLHEKYKEWGHNSSATRITRENEHPLEVKVSEKIRSMPFLWLKVADSPGPHSLRKFIEKNSIALLSNYYNLPIDEPSKGWLGHHSLNVRVKYSGLWNDEYVDENYDSSFLDVMDRLVNDMD